MSCVFVCVLHLKTLERKRDTENGGETCDTIKRCALCPLAHGYSREQRAHRNPLEEPDYLSALKLIKWVWGSVCVRVCVCVCVWERERDLVVLIFFFSCFFFFLFFQANPLVFYCTERQMGAGGAWICMAVFQHEAWNCCQWWWWWWRRTRRRRRGGAAEEAGGGYAASLWLTIFI